MHVIFVPYSLMKVDPASWMKMVTKFKGIVAIVINSKVQKLMWPKTSRELLVLGNIFASYFAITHTD